MTDNRETDRRSEDKMLAQKVEMLIGQMESFSDGTFEVPGTGRTAIEIAHEHDTLFAKQDALLEHNVNIVNLLEGQPIISSITGEQTGRMKGLVGQVDELYQGINGGEALRWKREWTAAQQWVVGLFATTATGIFLLLLAAFVA
jgi:hypothetical protein